MIIKLSKYLLIWLISLLASSSAFAAAGDWDFSAWQYVNTLSPVPSTVPLSSSLPISTSSVTSAGTPGITAQVDRTATGSISQSSVVGTPTSIVSTTLYVEVGANPVTWNDAVQFNFSPTISTFGSAQGNAFLGSKGFTLSYRPLFASSLTAATFTITLQGGATFGAIGGTTGRFELNSGGVGATSVTYKWNPASSASANTAHYLNGLVINGPVTGITVTRSNTLPGGFARGTGNDTVQYAVRVDPSVITLPPVAVPTISPWGTGALALLLGAAGIMIRRRRHT